MSDHLDDCLDAPSWAEGMFLLPQHFQQQELYFSAQIAANSRLDHCYPYGVMDFELSNEGLNAWKVQVQRLVGRTKSGLQFSFREGEVPSLNLDAEEFQEIKSRLLKNEAVTLYIAFPAMRPANRNISPDGGGGDQMGRYREYETERYDLRIGENPRSIVLKRLRPRLLFSADQAADYDLLPLCRLKIGVLAPQRRGPSTPPEAGKPGIGLAIDSGYFPPMTRSMGCPMACSWWTEIAYRLEAYMQRLAAYFAESGVGLRELSNPEEAPFIVAFQSLSRLRAWFLVHNTSRGVSPLEAHIQLCRTAGDLAWVNPGHQLLRNVPAYDHDQVLQSWNGAWQLIEECFVDPKSKGVVQIPLLSKRERFSTGNETVFSASINSVLFSENWRFYIGIFIGAMSKEDATVLFHQERLFFNAQLCPWKMGAASEIESIFTEFKTGVVMQEDESGKFKYEREMPGLSKKQGWIFYDIKPNGYWQTVKDQANVTLRFVPHVLLRADERQGEAQIQLSINDKHFKVGVSLWAVRRD